MKAFKCDICGKYYSGYGMSRTPLVLTDIIINSRKHSILNVYLGTDDDYCDVCPECTSDLQKCIDNLSKNRSEK